MIAIERQDLSCKKTCPFIQKGLRPCGLGYAGRVLVGWEGNKRVEQTVGQQRLCRDTISALIEKIDMQRSEAIAGFTDGDMTMDHLLTISHHTDHGLLPVGGVINGEYIPIPQLV